MARLMRDSSPTHIDYGDFVGLVNAPGFTPSNVDGIAETKGHFLIMEWKRPKESVSKGQQYMLEALAKKPDFNVVIIRGDTDNGVNIQKFYEVLPTGGCELIGNGWEEFKQYYIGWFNTFNGNQK